jgi:hypothetical protein
MSYTSYPENSQYHGDYIDTRRERLWMVTGTFHGSWVFAKSEGEARRAFHRHYNGESILSVRFGALVEL